MPRSMCLVFLLLTVVLVSSLEDPVVPARGEIELSSNNANDLDADASSYIGYYKRYGWNGGYGWGGKRWGGGGWGRGWNGRGAWW